MEIQEILTQLQNNSMSRLRQLAEKRDNRAIRHLGYTGSPEQVGYLHNLLINPDYSDVWSNIVAALGKIGSPEVVQILLPLLNNLGYYDIHSSIVDALGEIRSPAAIQPLLTLLNNLDYSGIWSNVVDALGKIGSPEAVQPLYEKILNDPIYSIFQCSILKFGSLDLIRSLLDNLISIPTLFMHEAANIICGLDSQKAIPILNIFLNNPELSDFHKDIIIALVHNGSEEAVHYLNNLIDDPDCSQLHNDIISALSYNGSIEAIALLEKLLDNSHFSALRNNIIIALAYIRSEEAIALLEKLLDNSHFSALRNNIIVALALNGSEKVVVLLDNPDYAHLHNDIIIALAYTKPRIKTALVSRVVPQLITMLNDSDIHMSKLSEKALSRIFAKNIGTLCRNRGLLKLYLDNLEKFSPKSLSIFARKISNYNINMSVALLTSPNILQRSGLPTSFILPPNVAKDVATKVAEFTSAANKDGRGHNI